MRLCWSVVFLRLFDGDFVREWLSRSVLASWVMRAHNLDLDTDDTLSQHDVADLWQENARESKVTRLVNTALPARACYGHDTGGAVVLLSMGTTLGVQLCSMRLAITELSGLRGVLNAGLLACVRRSLVAAVPHCSQAASGRLPLCTDVPRCRRSHGLADRSGS